MYVCLRTQYWHQAQGICCGQYALSTSQALSIMSGCSSQATSDSKDHDGPNTKDAAPNDEAAGPKYGCTKCRWR